MKINQLLIFLVLAVMQISETAAAKTLHVRSLELVPIDISARMNQQYDKNGKMCALIKIALPIKGCTFDGGVVNSVYDVNEYLVHVSPSTEKMRIDCPGYEPLEIKFGSESDFELREGVTYILKVSGYSESNLGRDGQMNGHPYVDIGLSSGNKWAKFNLGAENEQENEQENGDCYAWGYTTPLANDNYVENMHEISANIKYDAAMSSWGKPWRTPSLDDYVELFAECTISRHKAGNHTCLKITGPNGNYISLPLIAIYAMGEYIDYSPNDGEYTYYWTSTAEANGLASCLSANEKEAFLGSLWVYYNCPIRPVFK